MSDETEIIVCAGPPTCQFEGDEAVRIAHAGVPDRLHALCVLLRGRPLRSLVRPIRRYDLRSLRGEPRRHRLLAYAEAQHAPARSDTFLVDLRDGAELPQLPMHRVGVSQLRGSFGEPRRSEVSCSDDARCGEGHHAYLHVGPGHGYSKKRPVPLAIDDCRPMCCTREGHAARKDRLCAFSQLPRIRSCALLLEWNRSET